VHPVGDLVESLCEILNRERFTETSASFISLLVALTSVFLSSLVSSAGALADSSSFEMSSKYRSGRVLEGPGVSPVAMKTWPSGVPRSESVVATSVDVFSYFGARGIPSWKGSKSR
jgi:hypothetical protein